MLLMSAREANITSKEIKVKMNGNEKQFSISAVVGRMLAKQLTQREKQTMGEKELKGANSQTSKPRTAAREKYNLKETWLPPPFFFLCLRYAIPFAESYEYVATSSVLFLLPFIKIFQSFCSETIICQDCLLMFYLHLDQHHLVFKNWDDLKVITFQKHLFTLVGWNLDK